VTRVAKIGLIVAVVTFLVVSYVVISFLWHVDKPRIVARAVSPDGVEMCIEQELGDWSDFPFFTTRFVFRKPGTNWGWFYYDHEDDYWRTSRVVLDTNSKTAVFYRKDAKVVTFQWDAEIYLLHRWRWGAITGAQSYLPTGWEPGIKQP
jgi:hypothetical protein